MGHRISGQDADHTRKHLKPSLLAAIALATLLKMGFQQMLGKVAELRISSLILWLAFNLSLYQYDKVKQLLKCQYSQPFPKRGMLSFKLLSLLPKFSDAMVWIFVDPPSPPNWYFEILMLHVMVLGDGGSLWEVIRLTNTLMNEINALLKEAWGNSLAPSTTWGHREKSVVCNREESSHRNSNMLVILILDFQPPELEREEVFCCA